MRRAQRREGNLWAVGACNYIFAFCFHFIRALGQGQLPSSFGPQELSIGVLGGLAYVGTFSMYFPLMRLRGVSISSAVVRLAAALPVLVSILAWGERPTLFQGIGAFLALGALPLLTIEPGERAWHLDVRHSLLLLGLFVGSGLCSLSIKTYQQLGGEASSPFLATLFGTAAVIATVVWVWQRRGSSWRDLPSGVALGFCNALANLSLLGALRSLPSVVVFPFYSVVGLLYLHLFASLVWKERIRRLEAFGMGIALVAIALMNLR